LSILSNNATRRTPPPSTLCPSRTSIPCGLGAPSSTLCRTTAFGAVMARISSSCSSRRASPRRVGTARVAISAGTRATPPAHGEAPVI
jgi:hypothetical protein